MSAEALHSEKQGRHLEPRDVIRPMIVIQAEMGTTTNGKFNWPQIDARSRLLVEGSWIRLFVQSR